MAREFRTGDAWTREAARRGGKVSAEARRRKAASDVRTRGLLGHLLTLTTSDWFDRFGLTEPSWGPSRVLGKAYDGLPLDATEAEVYRALTGRETVPGDLQETWEIAGRGSGKTTRAVVQAVRAACRGYGNVRGVPRVLLLAFVKDQAGQAFDYVQEFFDGDPELRRLIARRTRTSLDLAHGVRIETIVSNFRVVRGYNVAFAHADEVAFWWNEDSNANPDVEVFRALRPALAKVPGSRLMVTTSPWTAEGTVHQAHEMWHGKEDPHVLVTRAPTLALHPGFDAARIARAERTDPEAAASEYHVAWRVAGGSLVRPEVLDAAIEAGVVARAPEEPTGDDWYTAAVDLAGGTGEDSATLTILHEEEGEGGAGVAVQDVLVEWRAPFDPGTMCAEAARECARFRVTVVVGDQFSEGFAAAEFRRHGIRYEVSPRKTADCVLDSIAVLNTRRVRLLDNPRARRQWTQMRRDYASGGRPTILDARRRDDLAVVTARGIVATLRLGEEQKPKRQIAFR